MMVLIESQEQHIKALEQELKKDSHNSDKPPSQDSYERKQVGRKKPRSARKKKPGGQKGASGNDAGDDERSGRHQGVRGGALRMWAIVELHKR